MRIAINGAGVAGPTLAWWLRRYGHEPVLFEKAPRLRTGGYVIDFWGTGYDVAERMGLLPALRRKGYRMTALRMVDRRGRKVAGMDVGTFGSFVRDRYLSIARGDIAAAIYHACGGVETRFGTSVVGIEPRPDGVTVRTSDGAAGAFDLVVGADGLHSHVRELAFGPESRFERRMGFYVAAFTLPGYRPRDELVYISHTVPKRQVGRVSLRDDLTLFLFVCRADLVDGLPPGPREPRAILREVFRDLGWEVPHILARVDEAEDVYFDRVSQIHMGHWTSGRVALIGDAAACVSLLGGEGTGLAMTEAYVLAGELHRAGGDYAAAFRQYETRLRPLLADKQKAARSFAGFFAPKTHLGLVLRNLMTNIVSLPLLGRLLIGRAFRDDSAELM